MEPGAGGAAPWRGAIEDEVLARVAEQQQQQLRLTFPGMPKVRRSRSISPPPPGQDVWRTVGVQPSSILQGQRPPETAVRQQPAKEVRELLDDPSFAARRWTSFTLCGLGSFCAYLPAASALYINAIDQSGGTENPCTTLSCEFAFGGVQREMIEALFSAGNVLGCVLGGWVADRCGRRPALWGGVLCLAATGALSAFEPAASGARLPFFAAMHALSGMSAGAVTVSALVLAIEWLPLRHHAVLVCIFANFSVLAAPTVAALHELVAGARPWRILLSACALAPALLAPVLFLLLRESPRYLLAVRGPEAAVAALIEARRPSAASAPAPVLRDPHAYCGGRTSAGGGIEGLWGQPQPGWWVVRYASGVALMFYGAGLPYFGIRWLGGTGGTLAVALSVGATAVVGHLFAAFMVSRSVLGRKLGSLGVFQLMGLGCGAAIFFDTIDRSTGGGGAASLGRRSLTLIVIGAAQATRAAITVWGSELLPTTVRGRCIGIAFAALGCSAVSAPWANRLASVLDFEEPQLLLGAILILASVAALFFLPETYSLPSGEVLYQLSSAGSQALMHD